jgi:flagellar hook-associated protein 1 FlgK
LYATTGNPTFFDDDAVDGNPLGVVTAQNIQLNSVVAGDIRKIAASDTAGEPSNRANAQRIAQLRDNTTAPLLGGMTISNYYLTSLTGLGVSLRVTNNQKATQDLLNQQLVDQRDSVMGVSIDEEMTNMIRFQNAFEASARFIATIDEMMQLINSLKR